MCGICCIFYPENEFNKEEIDKIYCICEHNLKRRGPDAQNVVFSKIKNWNFLLASSVLWLQGGKLTDQPIETSKSWFLYNGDVFGDNILPSKLRRDQGDTKPLLDILENSDSYFNILSNIQGPYAFILIDKTNYKLYFGRDTFGRRSLLIGRDKNKIILSSVAGRKMHFPMMELPALGSYCIDLNLDILKINLQPWKIQNQHFTDKLNEIKEFLSINITVQDHKQHSDIIYNIPNESQTILLENIEKLSPDKAFELLLKDQKFSSNISASKTLLENAIFRRIDNQPKYCKDCIQNRTPCDHCTVGILFSGGVDCSILCLLADACIPPHRQIDLMNVAFEKEGSFDTPDRITARQTLKELERLRPDRKWNLLEINISQNELDFERKDKISDLIYPLDSILDESLGCALWFAARGKEGDYVSPCRVLLVGMGADELFGGYTRHRAAFKRGSWSELAKELDNDWKNISHRNLARDDRVISDHGRQVRTPYLDENFVDFVRNLDAWDRCYPSDKLIQGLGDKLLLRSLAYSLGLTQAAILKKRALQFGSRIANKKENAHDKSTRL